MHPENFLHQKLEDRKKLHLFRTLNVEAAEWVDFSSNDYLGLAQSQEIQTLTEQRLKDLSPYRNGSTGSRLLAGNTQFAEALEQKLAKFHQAEAGLIFNSGYTANVGLLACMAGKNDTYISDELVHASMIDGMRLSYAKRYRFKHNDVVDLEKKLQQAQGNKFVVVESIYSMDGDAAPLKEITALCEQYGALLIVDEAHGIGVFGERGGGKVMELGLQSNCFARVYTFGKGPGCHGAIIVGSAALRDYLINFSRSFIYTTALPMHALATIESAYVVMSQATQEREHLHELIQYFTQTCEQVPAIQLIPSESAIQCVLISGNEAVTKVADALQQEGIWAKAVRSPTVAVGKERIRICLHAYNSKVEVDQLITGMERVLAK
ncbi:MAG: aminotransferase class I/II-fold pyridoxal phosphate-dependent enzyme [Flammeovirgaceae bacterium]